MSFDTRIMKRHTGDQTPARVAFNFEDVQSRCEDYKEQIKEECRQLVLQAEQRADEIRGRAEAAGQSEGYRNGLAQAESVIAERSQQRAEVLVSERLNTVVPAVASLLDELTAARSHCCLQWEQELVATAMAIAGRILGQHLDARPEIAADVISHVVQLAIGSTSLQVQMNPVDLESLGRDIRARIQDSAHGISVELTADESVSPGGCIVNSEHGQVDGRMETMLERIASELLDGLESP